MLIDDSEHDNFFHERVIRKADASKEVVVFQSARKGLDFLRTRDDHNDMHPELIFLDVNMPGMDGWEFLVEYAKLEERFRSQVVVIMLSHSENPEDATKAQASGVAAEFRTKPLTEELLAEILQTYFVSSSS